MTNRPKGFVTIVETVYHQLIDSQPHGEPRNFSIPLATSEQPFERRLVIGEEWKTLAEYGCWVKECSMLTIHNDTGAILQRNPTNEEAATIEQAVVELNNGVLVRPGRSCRLEPSDLQALAIRCQSGKATVKVVVYPK